MEFETFEGAETIRVAVTGDLPPLDYISEDGSPAGYNTALIAELGKRMRINIDILNIESSSRTLSLITGVADVIFWYLYGENYVVTDMANGIQLSDPYYSLNNWFYLHRKEGTLIKKTRAGLMAMGLTISPAERDALPAVFIFRLS